MKRIEPQDHKSLRDAGEEAASQRRKHKEKEFLKKITDLGLNPAGIDESGLSWKGDGITFAVAAKIRKVFFSTNATIFFQWEKTPTEKIKVVTPLYAKEHDDGEVGIVDKAGKDFIPAEYPYKQSVPAAWAAMAEWGSAWNADHRTLLITQTSGGERIDGAGKGKIFVESF